MYLRRKPSKNATYNRSFWPKFAKAQPAVDLPMLGPGRAGGVNDYSPGHHDGVFGGSPLPLWVATPIGMSLLFGSGNSSIITCSGVADPGQGDIAFGGWFILLSGGSFTNCPFIGKGSLNGDGFFLSLNNSSSYVAFQYFAAANTYQITATVALGIPFHLCGVKVGTSLNLYVNGLLAASTVIVLGNTRSGNYNFTIGGAGGRSANCYCLNAFYLSGIGLTANQVNVLYNHPWAMFESSIDDDEFAKDSVVILSGRRRRSPFVSPIFG